MGVDVTVGEPTFELVVECLGPSRDAAGGETVRIALTKPATVAHAVAALSLISIELAELLPTCAIALGDEIVARDHPLSPGDEIAVLPPVSGGC